jgi:hypothetical protein
MTSTAEPTGTVDTALAHAKRLLLSNPRLAVEQAGEILKVAPNHPLATLLLGTNQCAFAYCYEHYRIYPIKPMNFGVKFGQKF